VVWNDLNNNRECWWPVSLDFVMDLGTRSTNRVEGFFRNRKFGFEHRRVRLADLGPRNQISRDHRSAIPFSSFQELTESLSDDV
jgi:hypothetical protein